VVEIEIQHLVDRLESLLNESWLIPLTSNRIINEEEYLDIIDQMRITIPAGIKQAKRIQQERERIIAQAQEEAERIVTLAREQAANRTNEHEVLKTAETKAEALLEQAQQQAEDIRAGADDYVIEVLSELEEQLMVFLTTVRNGLKAVQRERGRKEDASDSQNHQF
jgi:cell division septum initiation protein DivIVA